MFTVQETFSGFSRSAVIIILSIFILADGLKRAGLADKAGELLLSLAGSSERSLAVVSPTPEKIQPTPTPGRYHSFDCQNFVNSIQSS